VAALSPDRWREISPYLDHALSLSEGERAAWLAALRAERPALADLLEKLLEEHRALAEERFLEHEPLRPANQPSSTGETLGAYKLVSRIGEGGMGNVWLAERADGRFERQVAVKFLHFALASQGAAERFKREGTILGQLAHHHIAELIDAGVTSRGEPYLVLEYVNGLQIDEYCDERGLDVGARTKLFLDVLDAVAHAHVHLVVHRDIKPSNVLVRSDGEVKLLDFGIAKLLADDVNAGAPTLTVESGGALTPQFAAPEQVSGGAITTATDVYSLAVLLYVLLTGQHPAGPGPHSPADLVKAITEREPPRPSDAVAGPRAQAESVAAKRGSTPEKLSRQLRGDLDTIVSKALKKNPQERYGSVNAFAEDLRRYLRNEPITARPDTLAYHTAKFIRRNRVSFSAAVFGLTAIIVSSGIAIYQARISQRRFQDVRNLAHTFVFDLYDKVAALEGSTQAREMMVRTGLQYLDDLARNAGGDLDLQREIADAYLKIGDAEGFPTKPNLGRISDAVTSYQKAGIIYRKLAAKNAAYLPDLAAYYLKYAGLIRFTHNPQRARELSESAIQTFDRIRGRGELNPQLQSSYIGAWCTAGDMDEDMGKFRLAWTEFSRCGDLARAQLKSKRDVQTLYEVGEADERIQSAARELGRLDEALGALDENQSVLSEMLAAEPRNPAFHRLQALVYQDRSEVYYDDLTPSLDDPSRGLPWAKRYLTAAEEMVRSDHANTSAQTSRAIAAYEVTLSLREFDTHAAIRMARNSLRMFDRMTPSEQSSYLVRREATRALQQLGDAQLKAGLASDAQRTAEATLQRERSIVARDPTEWQEQSELVLALILAGRANAATGNFKSAESLLREAQSTAQPIAKRGELTDLIPLASADRALGEFYVRRRQTAQARSCYQVLLGLWQSFPETNEYVKAQKAASERLLVSTR
jgi:serine/threonine protein kinase